MTERDIGGTNDNVGVKNGNFEPRAESKFDVYEVDSSSGYLKRSLDLKVDKLVESAEALKKLDEKMKFDKEHWNVISDTEIDRTMELIEETGDVLGIPKVSFETPQNRTVGVDENHNEHPYPERTWFGYVRDNIMDSRLARKITSWVVAAATIFQLGSAIPVRADESTPAPADPSATHSAEAGESLSEDEMPTTIEGYTPAPGNPLETEPYISDAYDIYKEEVSSNKEFLKENECLPENLDGCARAIYSIQNCKYGFRDKSYDHQERTILSNYVSIDNIVEFGRTGKCEVSEGVELNGIRDNDGQLNFFYVGASDYNIGVDMVEDGILAWDPDRQDFLNFIRDCNVSFLYQNKAGKTAAVHAKFGYGILYLNYGKVDKKAKGKGDCLSFVENILLGESIANRLFIIEGEDMKYVSDSPILKFRLAVDITEYLVKEKGTKFYKNMLKAYKVALKDYEKRYPAVGNIDSLVDEIKENDLVPSFGADSWKIIG